MNEKIQLIGDNYRVETLGGKRVRQFLADNQCFLVYDITNIEVTRRHKFLRRIDERAIVLPDGFRLVRIHGVDCHAPEEITQEEADSRGIKIFRGLP